VTKGELKGNNMRKLKWYKFIEERIKGDKYIVWAATYKGNEGWFDLTVFPMSLPDKNEDGWEYRIDEYLPNGGITGEQYDSALDSTDKSYAPTAKVAMKWAEATLEGILEERRAKK